MILDIGRDTNLIGAINNLSFVFPSFPVLTQPGEIQFDTFCDEQNVPARCTNIEFCPCTHRLKVKLNSIVELTIIDETESILLFIRQYFLSH